MTKLPSDIGKYEYVHMDVKRSVGTSGIQSVNLNIC